MLLIAISPRRPLNFGTFNSRTFIKQPCKAWTCLQLISSKHFRRHKISQNGPRWFNKLTFSPVIGQMRNQIQTSLGLHMVGKIQKLRSFLMLESPFKLENSQLFPLKISVDFPNSFKIFQLQIFQGKTLKLDFPVNPSTLNIFALTALPVKKI